MNQRSIVDVIPAEAERRLFHGELLRFEILRRYRPGWTRRTFADRFGMTPPIEWAGDLPAHYIRPETYSWLRARSIAYAQACESQAKPQKRRLPPKRSREFHELSNVEAREKIIEWRTAGASETDLVRMTDWSLDDVRRALLGL